MNFKPDAAPQPQFTTITVKDLYRDNDTTTPVIILAGLMERILVSK